MITPSIKCVFMYFSSVIKPHIWRGSIIIFWKCDKMFSLEV